MSNLKAQSSYTTIGNSTIIWIVRFEVYDTETRLPIRSVKIEMQDRNRKVFSINADRNGIGVVIITEPRYIPSSGIMRITAPNYRYEEFSFDKYDDFVYKEKEKILRLPDKINNRELDWTCGNCIPSASTIANYLSTGEYLIGSSRGNIYYNGPDFYEYNIALKPTIIEYQNRNRERNYDNNPINFTDSEESKIVRIPATNRVISVAPNDLSGSFYWLKAKEECASLKSMGFDDWYLPSIEDLEILYSHRHEVPNLKKGWYWSSSVTGGNRIWIKSFDTDIKTTVDKSTINSINTGTMCVRCIRLD